MAFFRLEVCYRLTVAVLEYIPTRVLKAFGPKMQGFLRDKNPSCAKQTRF